MNRQSLKLLLLLVGLASLARGQSPKDLPGDGSSGGSQDLSWELQDGMLIDLNAQTSSTYDMPNFGVTCDSCQTYGGLSANFVAGKSENEPAIEVVLDNVGASLSFNVSSSGNFTDSVAVASIPGVSIQPSGIFSGSMNVYLDLIFSVSGTLIFSGGFEVMIPQGSSLTFQAAQGSSEVTMNLKNPEVDSLPFTLNSGSANFMAALRVRIEANIQVKSNTGSPEESIVIIANRAAQEYTAGMWANLVEYSSELAAGTDCTPDEFWDINAGALIEPVFYEEAPQTSTTFYTLSATGYCNGAGPVVSVLPTDTLGPDVLSQTGNVLTTTGAGGPSETGLPESDGSIQERGVEVVAISEIWEIPHKDCKAGYRNGGKRTGEHCHHFQNQTHHGAHSTESHASTHTRSYHGSAGGFPKGEHHSTRSHSHSGAQTKNHGHSTAPVAQPVITSSPNHDRRGMLSFGDVAGPPYLKSTSVVTVCLTTLINCPADLATTFVWVNTEAATATVTVGTSTSNVAGGNQETAAASLTDGTALASLTQPIVHSVGDEQGTTTYAHQPTKSQPSHGWPSIHPTGMPRPKMPIPKGGKHHSLKSSPHNTGTGGMYKPAPTFSQEQAGPTEYGWNVRSAEEALARSAGSTISAGDAVLALVGVAVAVALLL